MRDKMCFSEALAEAQRPVEAKPRQRPAGQGKGQRKMHFLLSTFLSQVVLFSSGAGTFSIA